jgi:hypothetical protein
MTNSLSLFALAQTIERHPLWGLRPLGPEIKDRKKAK